MRIRSRISNNVEIMILGLEGPQQGTRLIIQGGEWQNANDGNDDDDDGNGGDDDDGTGGHGVDDGGGGVDDDGGGGGGFGVQKHGVCLMRLWPSENTL